MRFSFVCCINRNSILPNRCTRVNSFCSFLPLLFHFLQQTQYTGSVPERPKINPGLFFEFLEPKLNKGTSPKKKKGKTSFEMISKEYERLSGESIDRGTVYRHLAKPTPAKLTADRLWAYASALGVPYEKMVAVLVKAFYGVDFSKQITIEQAPAPVPDAVREYEEIYRTSPAAAMAALKGAQAYLEHSREGPDRSSKGRNRGTGARRRGGG